MRALLCSQLVFDRAIYPRQELDDSHVQNLVLALEAGAEMPPAVICQKTRRVVDGMHRMTATMRARGPDAEIQVVEKQYLDDREMFLDAIKFNANHGLPLSDADRQRCALRVRNLGGSDQDLMLSLSIPREAASRLTARWKRPVKNEKRFSQETLGPRRCERCGCRIDEGTHCGSCKHMANCHSTPPSSPFEALMNAPAREPPPPGRIGMLARRLLQELACDPSIASDEREWLVKLETELSQFNAQHAPRAA